MTWPVPVHFIIIDYSFYIRKLIVQKKSKLVNWIILNHNSEYFLDYKNLICESLSKFYHLIMKNLIFIRI